jgi:hypothetical protein
MMEGKRIVVEIESETKTKWDVIKRMLLQNSYSPHTGYGVRQHAWQGSNKKQDAKKRRTRGGKKAIVLHSPIL